MRDPAWMPRLPRAPGSVDVGSFVAHAESNLQEPASGRPSRPRSSPPLMALGFAAVDVEVEAAGKSANLLLQILPVDVKPRHRQQQPRVRQLYLRTHLIAPERVRLQVVDVR